MGCCCCGLVGEIIIHYIEMLRDAIIIRYIDNKPALPCLVKGFSKRDDLCSLAGRLWYEAGSIMALYRAEYVEPKLNLADGPSRDNVTIVEQIGAKEVDIALPRFSSGLYAWMPEGCEVNRMVT